MTNKQAQAKPNAKSRLGRAAPQTVLAPPMNAPFGPSPKGLIPGLCCWAGTTCSGFGHVSGVDVLFAAYAGVEVDPTNRNIEYIKRETCIPFWKPFPKSFLLVDRFLFFLCLLNLYSTV